MTNCYPSAPVKGEPIRADFFGAILRCLRRQRVIAGPGIRTLETANGTHVWSTVRPVAGSPAKETPGCFEMVSFSVNAEDETIDVTFANCYYRRADKFKIFSESDFSNSFSLADLDLEDEEPTRAVICLQLDATTLDSNMNSFVMYKLDEMLTKSKEAEYELVPLYGVEITEAEDSDGNTTYSARVFCDFRKGATGVAWEI